MEVVVVVAAVPVEVDVVAAVVVVVAMVAVVICRDLEVVACHHHGDPEAHPDTLPWDHDHAHLTEIFMGPHNLSNNWVYNQ